MIDLSRLAAHLTGDCPDTIWEQFTDFAGHLGFDCLLRYDARGAVPVVRSTLGPDWERYYLSRNYAAIDPFLQFCLKADRPMATGAAYVDTYEYLRPDQKTLIGEAGEAGFRAGFSIVLPDQPAIAWNIGSSLNRREVETLRHEMRRTLPLALRMVNHRMEPRLALSPRETEVMAMLAAGMRPQEIAHALGLAPVTVELHLRNARLKLGARTRDQALLYFSYGRYRG